MADLKDFREAKTWVKVVWRWATDDDLLAEAKERLASGVVPPGDAEQALIRQIAQIQARVDAADPEQVEPNSFTARIAYAPASLGEEDAALLAQFDRVRLADMDGFLREPAAEVVAENRQQRRSRERAEQRADATPAERATPAPTAYDYLLRFLVDWDLTYGGESLPITRESLALLEFGLRREMMFAILLDYLERPNRMTSLLRSSAAMVSGPSTLPRSSSPNSTEHSPGPTSVTPNGGAGLSGVSGSAT